MDGSISPYTSINLILCLSKHLAGHGGSLQWSRSLMVRKYRGKNSLWMSLQVHMSATGGDPSNVLSLRSGISV